MTASSTASASRSRLCGTLLLLCAGAVAQTTDAQRLHRLVTDFGGLTHYGSDNSELRPPKPGESRVVFLGDEITENWGKGEAPFFPGKPYLNRGIARQTTPQMLVRFRQDVIALRPKVVVIEAGTNDVAGLTGPSTEDVAGENIMSMVELAKLHDIRVVLASVPPVCDCFTKQTALRRQAKINEMNEWIKDYASHSGSVFLDYFSALADGDSFKKELTVDGLLPNDAGYRVMAPLAERAIAEALSSK